jgi:hypothetical protein
MHSAGVEWGTRKPHLEHPVKLSVGSGAAIGSVAFGPRFPMDCAARRSSKDGSARSAHMPLELPKRAGGSQALTAIIVSPAGTFQQWSVAGGSITAPPAAWV